MEFTLDVSLLALEFTLGVCLLACLPGVGGLRQKAAIYLRAYKAPYGKLPIMSIENPTLAHFRHFSHFRHSVPRSFPTNCTILKGVRIITYFQTHSILTNKPNFQKSQMNVTIYYTKLYKNETAFRRGKNKPNSNPIKPCPERSRMGQFPKSQNERKLNFNKGLQKKR